MDHDQQNSISMQVETGERIFVNHLILILITETIPTQFTLKIFTEIQRSKCYYTFGYVATASPAINFRTLRPVTRFDICIPDYLWW
jgi:hypothetical protein